MEKRNVVIDEDLSKTASTTQTCPKCGDALKQKDYCDKCGTEPFEKQPPKKEEP